jgi:hypothetical protein
MNRPFDLLTIEKIEALQAEAKEKGMEVDWEAGKLVPRKYAGMSHHQRDAVAAADTRRQHYKDLNDQQDNDAASPEQAWA